MRISTTENLRHQVCNIIGKLPVDISREKVADVLDRFCGASALNDEDKKRTLLGDGVTPIIVACDKGMASCLHYMNDHKNLGFIWGFAEGKSSVKLGANTALHHAGMSGCIEALSLLPSLSNSCSLLDLLSMSNAHGDTPIMLACVYNRPNFLIRVQELLHDGELIDLLKAENDSGSTPLTLSMEHGRPEILQWILNAGIKVSYEEMENFKLKLQAMDNSWLRAPPAIQKKYEEKRKNAKKCLIILQVTLAKKSHEAMENLIEEEKIAEKKQQNKSLGKGGSKRRPLLKASNKNTSENYSEEIQESSQPDSLKPQNYLNKPRFQTLSDGTVVARTVPNDDQASSNNKKSNAIIHNKNMLEPTAEDLLRKLLRGGTGGVLHAGSVYSSADDEVLDSLCLDPSMLLFSSHRMAMNLSPAQLETVDQILHQQIEAVKEARTIQERLRSAGF